MGSTSPNTITIVLGVGPRCKALPLPLLLLLLLLLQAALFVRAFVPSTPASAWQHPSSWVRASSPCPHARLRFSQKLVLSDAHVTHPHDTQPRPRAAVRMSLLQDPMVELSSYLKSQAGVETIPSDLKALLQLLHYRGEEPVSPAAGKDLGLHPLVVPLTAAADGDYTCLLRWPTPVDGAPIPVVKARGGLNGLRLVAQSTLELAHRLAAEEDHIQGKEADWVR